MDVASDHGSDHPGSKYSDPPIGYINVRRREARPPPAASDVHQSEDEDELSRDDGLESSQPIQHGESILFSFILPFPILLHSVNLFNTPMSPRGAHASSAF
ncbi:hypothetical protein FRC12_010401 [Ceratobasidium sp. 428]|nr:hypothetical protein FRC12_010401 [Ceratobasidium sp. 428]